MEPKAEKVRRAAVAVVARVRDALISEGEVRLLHDRQAVKDFENPLRRVIQAPVAEEEAQPARTYAPISSLSSTCVLTPKPFLNSARRTDATSGVAAVALPRAIASSNSPALTRLRNASTRAMAGLLASLYGNSNSATSP